MTAGQDPRGHLLRILSLMLLGLTVLIGGFAVLLAAADTGLLDRPIQRWASRKLDRGVTFQALHLQLLARHPRVIVEGLSLSNPPWIGKGNVARASHLDATLRWSALLGGRIEPVSLFIDNLSLHLVRVKAGQNNWTLGHPHKGERALAFLRGAEHVRVTGGRLDWLDLERGLRFRGEMRHVDGGPMPLLMHGQGDLNGMPFALDAKGGPLHGPAVDRPYPFAAHLIDGATIVNAHGTSGDAFDLARFTLAIDSRGQNLGDLGYLFNLRAPNSPPFDLETIATGEEARFTFSPIRIRFGDSDARGWIRADHSTGRHRAVAELWSHVWTKQDVRAVLSPIPPHRTTRSRSGTVPPERGSRWILPATPFPIANLQGLDLQARIHVARLRGYPLPLEEVGARIDLENGKLTYSSVRASVYGGTLAGTATLDVHRPVPMLAVDGRIEGLQLGRLATSPASRTTGALDIGVKLAGSGRSVHDAASKASGSASIRIANGSIPPAAAFMLGGDTLRALRSMGDVRRPIALDCLSAQFSATGGQLTTHDLAIQTGAGNTAGKGVLNLDDERLRLILTGSPRMRKPFQLAMPILIDGSLSRPHASLGPGRNAARLGLTGGLGVALSPLAALLPMGRQKPVHRPCAR